MIQESSCSLFGETLIKLFYQLQKRHQQRRQKSLELNHYPNRGIDRRAVSSSNRDAETGSDKAGDLNLQNFPDFKVFPV